MAQIIESLRKTKNGLDVTLLSPAVGAGAEILAVVKEIMAQSEHLLTEVDEFTYTTAEEDEMLKSYLDHPDKVIIVPKIDGKIVGMMNFCCGSKRKISHQGDFGMSVHPRFQGLGIGKLMLKELIEWANRNPRIETLRLRVHAKNTRAIALYRSMGFVDEGRELNGIKLQDGSYDDVISMARSVVK